MLPGQKDIVDGVNRKEMSAWKKLYAAFYAALCSYANEILKDRDAAQDVVQDTLIRLWNSERTFSSMKDLTWYLYRSVYNNALFYLRTLNNRQKLLRQMAVEEAEMPEEQFVQTVREELIRQLYVYIEQLPEERKKILLLSIEGHSGNEIAGMLGISINTVKTQKNRGFRFLRKKLKDSVLLFLL